MTAIRSMRESSHRQPRRGRGEWLSPFALRRLAPRRTIASLDEAVRRPARSCTVTVRVPAAAVERPVEVARERAPRSEGAAVVGDAHLPPVAVDVHVDETRGCGRRLALDHDREDTPAPAEVLGPVPPASRRSSNRRPFPNSRGQDIRAMAGRGHATGHDLLRRAVPTPKRSSRRARSSPGRTCRYARSSRRPARADRRRGGRCRGSPGSSRPPPSVGRRSGRSRRGARRSSGAAGRPRGAARSTRNPRRCSKSAWATAGASPAQPGARGGSRRGSGRGSRRDRPRFRRIGKAGATEGEGEGDCGGQQAAERQGSRHLDGVRTTHARYDVSVLLEQF